MRNLATGKLYVKREEMKMDRQKGEHKKITQLQHSAPITADPQRVNGWDFNIQ